MGRAARTWSFRLSVLFGCAAALACSSSAHPPAPSDLGGSEAPIVVAPQGADDGTDEPCTPGTWRDCRIYYYDDRGQLQCPLDIELCRTDGLGWYACGAYVVGDEGAPVPRNPDAGSGAHGR